jgi:hypothetical protein
MSVLIGLLMFLLSALIIERPTTYRGLAFVSIVTLLIIILIIFQIGRTYRGSSDLSIILKILEYVGPPDMRNISDEILSKYPSVDSLLDKVIQLVVEISTHATIILNLKLFTSFLEFARKQRGGHEKQKDTLGVTIVGILISRKAKQNFVAYLSLFISLITYTIIARLSHLEIRPEVVLLILGLILALFINQKILEYRIRKGLYGTNEYEAREILGFILSHADKSNFSGGQGLKEILPVPGIDDLHEYEPVEGIRGAEA